MIMNHTIILVARITRPQLFFYSINKQQAPLTILIFVLLQENRYISLTVKVKRGGPCIIFDHVTWGIAIDFYTPNMSSHPAI